MTPTCQVFIQQLTSQNKSRQVAPWFVLAACGKKSTPKQPPELGSHPLTPNGVTMMAPPDTPQTPPTPLGSPRQVSQTQLRPTPNQTENSRLAFHNVCCQHSDNTVVNTRQFVGNSQTNAVGAEATICASWLVKWCGLQLVC